MKIKYEAFDGRMFENEDDCEAYEFAHEWVKYRGRIKMYEADGTAFVDNTKQEAMKALEECKYVYIADEEASIFVKTKGFNWGFDVPYRPGAYEYDPEGEWVLLDETLAKYQKEYEFRRDLKAKMEATDVLS